MTLEKAISIAIAAHSNQYDKYGAPYIGHVMRVMNAGKTTDEKIVGILHDIVEDTPWTFDKLAAEGLAPHLIEALRCVTKITEDEDYDHFVNRTLRNRLACLVKLNDLADNMDIRRAGELSAKDIDRLNKYIKAYHRIAAHLAA